MGATPQVWKKVHQGGKALTEMMLPHRAEKGSMAAKLGLMPYALA
jgi:hypothetical protein